LLDQFGDDAKLLAGGHSLLPTMKLRLAQPGHLIDISKIADLRYVALEGDVLKIEGIQPYIKQDGQIVFRWATTALAPFAIEACHKAGIEPSDLAAFVPHQANTRIIDGIVKCLGLGPDVVVAKDLIESGNTSAASVPLALSKLVERREVPSGAPVLLFGFGGGLTYAGQVVRCP